MKKISTSIILLSILLSSNAMGYQLATSVYYPYWDETDPVTKEITPEMYTKNYLDEDFIKGIAASFSKQLNISDKEKKAALNKRVLEAVLGFHKKAVEEGRGGFFAHLTRTNTDFNMRASNMIDFIAIPILKSNKKNITLDDYTTKLQKSVIDTAAGKMWAGGKKVMLSKRFYSSNDYVLDAYPAKLEGVKYNSFVPEFLSLFAEANKYGIEISVLEQIEKISTLSHNEIEDAVEAFNKQTTGNSGLDHPVYEGYGYLSTQLKALTEATEIQKANKRGGMEYLKSIENNENNKAMPKRVSVNPNADNRIFERYGLQIPSTYVDAPELLRGDNLRVFTFTWNKMHLPALKQLYPEVWGNN